MARYSESDKEDLFYELQRFLENNPISEMIEVVRDAISDKEFKDKENSDE